MKKKVFVIIGLILVAIIVIAGIFGITIYKKNNVTKKENIIGSKILEPDRIVFRNDNDQYFQFKKGENKYQDIINIIEKNIRSYQTDGKSISDEEIDNIHSKSYIEFDYKTASKNYLIQLEKSDDEAVIKMATTGGNVVCKKIKNLSKIKQELQKASEQEQAYTLDYKEYISRNVLQSMEYKYMQQFKEVTWKIHQVVINNMEDYEKYSAMCKLAIDGEINEETFKNNTVVLTVSLLPKITPKVSIGNIKYTYERLDNVFGTYFCHVLVVSNIVNVDCIYNTDLSELNDKITQDNFKVEYDDSVQNMEDVFMKDYDEFLTEYNSSTSEITLDQAKEIAEKGFKEAERICGSYEESTQKVTTQNVKPNNFFTRKYSEGDKTYNKSIEAYVFTRVDDMDLNGVEVYVDKKTGKIIGGGAFGD